jgi:hypothetical protein
VWRIWLASMRCRKMTLGQSGPLFSISGPDSLARTVGRAHAQVWPDSEHAKGNGEEGGRENDSITATRKNSSSSPMVLPASLNDSRNLPFSRPLLSTYRP